MDEPIKSSFSAALSTAEQEGSHQKIRELEPDSARVQAVINQSRDWLLGQQNEDGHWCAELEGDSILQSEYLLLLTWLGKENSETAKKCAAQLLKQQRADGSWGMYAESKIDISASVKAYFALKLTGQDPKSEAMIQARDAILEAGGADAVNSFTRFYLALLGQIDYDSCPAVPPEMILLPTWFPINIYRMSSWSRTIFIPLALVWANKPVRQLEANQSIRELFIEEPQKWKSLRSPGAKEQTRLFSWETFFRITDRLLKVIEKCKLRPLRGRAVKTALKWMLDRFDKSDGLGAIFPPIIWSVIALRSHGFAEDSEEVQYCLDHLERLMIEENGTIRLQPCKSPVWDTTIAMRALAAASCGMNHNAGQRSIEWLLSKEVKQPGDWSKTVKCEPGGWFFEYENAFYPDLDDTAMGLMALKDQLEQAEIDLEIHVGESMNNTSVVTGMARVDSAAAISQAMQLEEIAACCKRAINWVVAMQNQDGGWGAFDKDNDAEFLCHVPFADHNAMIDPSTPDLSARVLEALGKLKVQYTSNGKLGKVVRKCVEYLRNTQETDGSWFGRWGVNYIYGTWQCLVGLREVGINIEDPMMVSAAGWLLKVQQNNGGWGETCNSYENPDLKGTGQTTPSQTAWALLGLMAAGYQHHSAVTHGINYLLETQQNDGTWAEAPLTGTGFPRVFYLRYHNYRNYFPLLALATWQRSQSSFNKRQLQSQAR